MQEGGKEEEGELALALANVGGVFLVLGIGIALSYVLALVEFLWNVRNVSVEEHVSIKNTRTFRKGSSNKTEIRKIRSIYIFWK